MLVSPVVLGLDGLRDLSGPSPGLLAEQDLPQGRGTTAQVRVMESWLGCAGRHLRGPPVLQVGSAEISPQIPQSGL